MALRRSNTELPSSVTVADVSSPDLLVRLLRDMADKVTKLDTKVTEVSNTPATTTVSHTELDRVQKALQANGSHPLNITGLRGIQGDVPAAVISLSAVPTGLALQSYKDSQLLLITNAPLELWVVRGGNPNVATKLI